MMLVEAWTMKTESARGANIDAKPGIEHLVFGIGYSLTLGHGLANTYGREESARVH